MRHHRKRERQRDGESVGSQQRAPTKEQRLKRLRERASTQVGLREEEEGRAAARCGAEEEEKGGRLERQLKEKMKFWEKLGF